MNEENELDSTCGVSDDELTRRFVEAVRISNEIKQVKGNPIQCWDDEKQAPYILYPDGSREYA
jgi:hypothetical protein